MAVGGEKRCKVDSRLNLKKVARTWKAKLDDLRMWRKKVNFAVCSSKATSELPVKEKEKKECINYSVPKNTHTHKTDKHDDR